VYPLLLLLLLQINDWLADSLPEGSRVGFDPFCHTVEAVNKLKSKLQVRAQKYIGLIHFTPYAQCGQHNVRTVVYFLASSGGSQQREVTAAGGLGSVLLLMYLCVPCVGSLRLHCDIIACFGKNASQHPRLLLCLQDKGLTSTDCVICTAALAALIALPLHCQSRAC
jgi:hypothetical protein